jgi:hypothetical protein
MVQKIIVKLSKEDRKANHVPDWVFELCHENDVFIEDFKTGELVQILDFAPLEWNGF